jgi:tetratricopeptide (TPR) repeat protein
MSAISPTPTGKRLDSWKEIAAFFGRDERTLSRWEKEQGLPVHRLPGTRGRVYAYTDELTAWSATPRNALAGVAEDRSAAQPDAEGSGLTVVAGRREPSEPTAIEGSPVAESALDFHRINIRLLTVVILGMAAIALVLFPLSTSRRSRIAGGAAPQPRQSAPVSEAVLASTHSHDAEAEQLYLKGRYYWSKRTPEDLNKALDYFMQAVVHDPNYSQAYVGLADCYNLMREYTLMPSSEAYPRALVAAKKAVELDDQSSEAHASLAFVSFFGMWDIAAGEREFRRAIDLNPKNPAPHHWYANYLLALHRYPEALTEIDQAQALDPASSAILADRGNVLWATGRHAEALGSLKQMEGRDPGFRSVHLYLEYAYLRERDYPNFLAELRKDAALVHDDSALKSATAAEEGFAAGGARGMFDAMLRVQKKLYLRHSVSPITIATTYALVGNKAETLRCLQSAYELRDGSLLFVETYPEFDSLHDEPAYRDLLARMNLPLQDTK